nr:uncharacterized protein LOC111427487 [Onthophagus taurus]
MAIRTFSFNQIRNICRNVEHLEIRLMQKNDRVKAKKFLEKHFYKRHPLLVLLNLDKSPSGIEVYDKYLGEAIKSELSLMMLDDRNEIIALSVNRIMDRYSNKIQFKDPRCQKLAFLVEAVDEKCNLFKKFGVDRYLKMEVLAADPTVENGGIQKKLIKITKSYAHRKSIKLIRFDTTGYYDAKAAINLGFKPHYSLNYENYVVNDVPIFRPPPPNTDYSVFVQTIDDGSNKPDRVKCWKPTLPNITFTSMSNVFVKETSGSLDKGDMRQKKSAIMIQNFLNTQKEEDTPLIYTIK